MCWKVYCSVTVDPRTASLLQLAALLSCFCCIRCTYVSAAMQRAVSKRHIQQQTQQPACAAAQQEPEPQPDQQPKDKPHKRQMQLTARSACFAVGICILAVCVGSSERLSGMLRPAVCKGVACSMRAAPLCLKVGRQRGSWHVSRSRLRPSAQHMCCTTHAQLSAALVHPQLNGSSNHRHSRAAAAIFS